MAKRPTGGLTLTHALTRHVHALGGSIVAVDFVRDDYDVAERRWEGVPIKCVRRGAPMHLSADVVVVIVHKVHGDDGAAQRVDVAR